MIGTGSTGIQVAPEIAAVASRLYVFQRTAHFAVPNRNAPVDPAADAALKAGYAEYRAQARESILGVPLTGTGLSALAVPADEREALFTERWKAGGGMPFLAGTYIDLLVSREANDTVAEFIRDRIRETVADPAVAELLCPRAYPVGAKRLAQSDDYYSMFNQPNVTLVDVRSSPISSVSASGLTTEDGTFYELDAIVFATGFDAISGALDRIDITGADGVTLRAKWAAGPHAYLGVAAAGFPNLFIVTGPGSPSVFSNMVLSIEQHVEWIRDAIGFVGLAGGGVHRGAGAGRGGMGGAHARGRVLHAVPAGRLLVRGGEYPGKGASLQLLRGRGWPLPGQVRRGGRQRVRGVRARVSVMRSRLLGGCGDSRRRRLTRRRRRCWTGGAPPGRLPAWQLTAPENRAGFGPVRELIGPGPAMASVRDILIPGRAGKIPARVYSPPMPGVIPATIVYYHGGGWVIGSVDDWDAVCRALALAIRVHAGVGRLPARAGARVPGGRR